MAQQPAAPESGSPCELKDSRSVTALRGSRDINAAAGAEFVQSAYLPSGDVSNGGVGDNPVQELAAGGHRRRGSIGVAEDQGVFTV